MENKFQFFAKIKSITTFDEGDDCFYEEGEHNDISTIDITTPEHLSTSKFHLLLEAALIPTVFGLKIIQEEEDGWHKVFFFETLDGINYIQVNPNQFYKMVNNVIDGNY